jgi:vacuolar-type H+-ATPase subunit I/STV1
MTDTSQEAVVDATTNEGEGENTQEAETVAVPKADYDKLNQTLGSLKRELKDLKKSKEDTQETSKTNAKPDENRLLDRIEKMTLRQANISHQDDVELAKTTAKKWNMDLEDVIADSDFKLKLERQQSERDNLVATSKIKSGAGTSQAKNTPEYWVAKGTPPTADDVPDRKTRATIARAMMSNQKSSKKFYND